MLHVYTTWKRIIRECRAMWNLSTIVATSGLQYSEKGDASAQGAVHRSQLEVINNYYGY